jgi:hypothetical protein
VSTTLPALAGCVGARCACTALPLHALIRCLQIAAAARCATLQAARMVLLTRPSIEFIHVHAFVISRVLRTVSAADAARLPTPCIQPFPYWSSGVCPVRLVLPCGLCCVLSCSNRSAQSTAALQQGPVLLYRRGSRSVGQATIWLLYTNELLGGRSSGPGGLVALC